MPEDYSKVLEQELEVCGMGRPSPLEALWLFHLPPHPEFPLQLFASGQQGGIRAIRKAISFQTDKNMLQHLSHAHTATNKTF